LYHAVFDPLDHLGGWWAVIWSVCPFLFFVPLFARGVPKAWLAIIAIVTLQNLIAPQCHYWIPAVPFFCLLSAKAITEKKLPRYAVVVAILLAGFSVCRMGLAIIRPWGLFSMRKFGIMDDYYLADLIKKQQVKEPVWMNRPMLYYIMGLNVPGNDFLAQINDGATIQWDKPPYDKVMTRIYFYHQNNEIKPQKEWKVDTYPVDRGQFIVMQIWRRVVEVQKEIPKTVPE